MAWTFGPPSPSHRLSPSSSLFFSLNEITVFPLLNYSSLPRISDDHPSSPDPVSHRDNHEPNDYLAFQNDDVTATTPSKPSFPTRTNRPSRACTVRASERLLAAHSVVERKPKAKKELRSDLNEETPQHLQQQQCSKIVTQLVEPPSPSQLPRWNLRSMWELAAVLNFFNVFRPLLNINVEFSAEEFESALISPNDTLSDVHIPLLKAIPPVTRMALTRETWVTVLCRKLRDWWFWVADGDLPLVASHGAEVKVYRTLDPGVRVVILKALCDIRVEQEDIRNYIDNSLKHGVQLSAFRKERIGGDSHGVFYWYEDDSLVGHRLYREIRKVELKKTKARGSHILPSSTYLWETVATSFDEFQDVSEKLFSSTNRSEVSLGKKLKIDMLPEIEKVHKRKERLLKKQHRQALLLDNFINIEDLGPGRSLRDRKHVTYTFDDYDRSINEAIKITKQKQPSPETDNQREVYEKPEPSSNGKWIGPSHESEDFTFGAQFHESPEHEETEEDQKMEDLDRSNRRRQRPQRYSEREFVEALSDNEADSDDDIVGEAIYDEEYLRQRKQRKKTSSSSEADEEYHYEEENGEEEEEEEDDDDDDEFSPSASDDSNERRKLRKFPTRPVRKASSKSRSVDELQSGLRRSKRARKNRINYKQYEISGSEQESTKGEKSNESDQNGDYSTEESPDSDRGIEDDEEIKNDQPIDRHPSKVGINDQPLEKSSSSPSRDVENGTRGRRFLDLNELAPGSGFDDGSNSVTKDNDQTK